MKKRVKHVTDLKHVTRPLPSIPELGESSTDGCDWIRGPQTNIWVHNRQEHSNDPLEDVEVLISI